MSYKRRDLQIAPAGCSNGSEAVLSRQPSTSILL